MNFFHRVADSGPSKSPQMNISKNIKNKKQNTNNNKRQKTTSSFHLLDIHSQQVVHSLRNLPPNAISFGSLNVCGLSSSNRQQLHMKCYNRLAKLLNNFYLI